MHVFIKRGKENSKHDICQVYKYGIFLQSSNRERESGNRNCIINRSHFAADDLSLCLLFDHIPSFLSLFTWQSACHVVGRPATRSTGPWLGRHFLSVQNKRYEHKSDIIEHEANSPPPPCTLGRRPCLPCTQSTLRFALRCATRKANAAGGFVRTWRLAFPEAKSLVCWCAQFSDGRTDVSFLGVRHRRFFEATGE